MGFARRSRATNGANVAAFGVPRPGSYATRRSGCRLRRNASQPARPPRAPDRPVVRRSKLTLGSFAFDSSGNKSCGASGLRHQAPMDHHVACGDSARCAARRHRSCSPIRGTGRPNPRRWSKGNGRAWDAARRCGSHGSFNRGHHAVSVKLFVRCSLFVQHPRWELPSDHHAN